MTRVRVVSTSFLVAVAAAWLVQTAPAHADAPADPPGHFAAWIGRPAPAIELKSVDGKAVSLADYKGKLVVLHFGASW